jgi:hypothetical protein
MRPKRITFWDTEIWRIIAAIEIAERSREISLVKEEEEHRYEASLAMHDLKYLSMDSILRKSWVCNPEPIVREAIKRLRKLNSLWAQNLASCLQSQFRPSPAL